MKKQSEQRPVGTRSGSKSTERAAARAARSSRCEPPLHSNPPLLGSFPGGQLDKHGSRSAALTRSGVVTGTVTAPSRQRTTPCINDRRARCDVATAFAPQRQARHPRRQSRRSGSNASIRSVAREATRLPVAPDCCLSVVHRLAVLGARGINAHLVSGSRIWPLETSTVRWWLVFSGSSFDPALLSCE